MKAIHKAITLSALAAALMVALPATAQDQKGMSGMQGQKGMGGMSGMEGQKGMGGMGGMEGKK